MSIVDAICENPMLPENLHIRFSNFEFFTVAYNYRHIAKKLSRPSTKLPKGLHLDFSAVYLEAQLELLTELLQNPNLPEGLVIELRQMHHSRNISSITALILESMRSGRIKAGTRILGLSQEVDALCADNDRIRSQYWHPHENTLNHPDFHEINMARRATTSVGCFLETHHPWFRLCNDDTRTDVVSFGHNTPST